MADEKSVRVEKQIEKILLLNCGFNQSCVKMFDDDDDDDDSDDDDDFIFIIIIFLQSIVLYKHLVKHFCA